MEYLHSRHVVHFDLKCDNLLADLRNTLQPLVKIGDMGLSKHKAATFMSGNMRGTLPWMAPEMFPAMSASKSGGGHQVRLLCHDFSRWDSSRLCAYMSICPGHWQVLTGLLCCLFMKHDWLNVQCADMLRECLQKRNPRRQS